MLISFYEDDDDDDNNDDMNEDDEEDLDMNITIWYGFSYLTITKKNDYFRQL